MVDRKRNLVSEILQARQEFPFKIFSSRNASQSRKERKEQKKHRDPQWNKDELWIMIGIPKKTYNFQLIYWSEFQTSKTTKET